MKPASDLSWPSSFVVYDERDLMARRMIVDIFTFRLKETLTALNRAVRFFQIETPILTPRGALEGHEATGFDLVTGHFKKHGEESMYLRPETTFGTFAAFRAMFPDEANRKKQMPVVLWQFGKSFRDEQTRPFGELRFREFYQLEYQLFASEDSKANYFTACANAAGYVVMKIAGKVTFSAVPESILAHYSMRTTDLMYHAQDDATAGVEVAAVSQRKDFPGAIVIETNVGVDRLTALQGIL